MGVTLLWISIVIGLISFVITGILYRYAIRNSIIDIPNERSSHTIPTPRGGGVAIVVTFLGALCVIYLFDIISQSTLIGILGGSALVAAIGFIDDHKHIPAGWRLLGHTISSIWLLFWIGGLPTIILFGQHVDLGWIGNVLAAIYLIWALNLYNFMDGIDGLASIEAVTTCLSCSILYFLSGQDDYVMLVYLAASVIGFLIWNFPPAKIFMGDAGSGFLGITLGALSIHSAWIDPKFLWVWMILLAVFITDASITLCRRLLRGKKIYAAHRCHAYQHAAKRYSHKSVSLSIGLINIVWLLPLAFLVAVVNIDGMLVVLIAYLPLIYCAIKYNAGNE